mmetsp:Transcript_30708/g.74828  ORF Transcript_30708/g.74828 Transcript_30708/m.74828 type:complete len:163 (-) Transcript_30708:295-783(-)
MPLRTKKSHADVTIRLTSGRENLDGSRQTRKLQARIPGNIMFKEGKKQIVGIVQIEVGLTQVVEKEENSGKGEKINRMSRNQNRKLVWICQLELCKDPDQMLNPCLMYNLPEERPLKRRIVAWIPTIGLRLREESKVIVSNGGSRRKVEINRDENSTDQRLR